MSSNDKFPMANEEVDETIVEVNVTDGDEGTIIEEPSVEVPLQPEPKRERKKSGKSNAGGFVAGVGGSVAGAAAAAAAPRIVSAIEHGIAAEGQEAETSSSDGVMVEEIEISPDDIEVVGLGDMEIGDLDITIDNISLGGEDYVLVDVDDVIDIIPEVADDDDVEADMNDEAGSDDMGTLNIDEGAIDMY